MVPSICKYAFCCKSSNTRKNIFCLELATTRPMQELKALLRSLKACQLLPSCPVSILTNPSIQQSNNLSKIQNEEWRSDGRSDKARQWSDLDPIKIELFSPDLFFTLNFHFLFVITNSPPSFYSPSPSSSLSTRVSSAISGVSGYRYSALCWTHAPLKAI